MAITPRGYWDNKANRINAIKGLVEKLDKNPNEMAKLLSIHFNKISI